MVGHIPYNLAPTVELFLRRDLLRLMVPESTKGLALWPGNYRLYGPKVYCDKLNNFY